MEGIDRNLICPTIKVFTLKYRLNPQKSQVRESIYSFISSITPQGLLRLPMFRLAIFGEPCTSSYSLKLIFRHLPGNSIFIHSLHVICPVLSLRVFINFQLRLPYSLLSKKALVWENYQSYVPHNPQHGGARDYPSSDLTGMSGPTSNLHSRRQRHEPFVKYVPTS
jgi:hypothetical protein